MPATDVYAFPFPDLTGPPNGPLQIQALAEAVDDALTAVAAVAPADGWRALVAGWAFGTADAPVHTYTMTVAGDQTALVSVGCRIKLTHAAAVKYFIVTAAAFAGGVTTLTLYGGTTYALAAGAITNVYASRAKAPQGFPLNPALWTEEYVNTSSINQTSPALNVWINPGSQQLTIPIGAWHVEWFANLYALNSAGTGVSVQGTLSSNPGGSTDQDLTGNPYSSVSGATAVDVAGPTMRRKLIVLGAKTIYYLLIRPTLAASTIATNGGNGSTTIRAVCAYL